MNVWRHNDTIKHKTWKCWLSAEYSPKLIFFFAKKIPNRPIRILPVFPYKEEKMVFLICSVSFRSISCRYFSTWWLTPVLGSTPLFFVFVLFFCLFVFCCFLFCFCFVFNQNDRKWCKRDYLDTRGHFVLRFGAIGGKQFGTPPPFGRRWLRSQTKTIPFSFSKHD